MSNVDLPYVFDLLWDIKTKSQLLNRLVVNIEEATSMFSCIGTDTPLTQPELDELAILMEELISSYRAMHNLQADMNPA